jgi:capsid protein
VVLPELDVGVRVVRELRQLCDFRAQIHREWLQQAAMSRAIEGVTFEQYALNTKKFEAVLFKPRGWSWIDPTKEVEAYKEAIKCGFTTVSDVVAQTAGGQDIEDVLATRARELKLMAAADLVFETSPEFYDKEEPAPAAPPMPSADDDPRDGKEPGAAGSEDQPDDPPARRVFSFRRP